MNDEIILFGEAFKRKHFPRVARMFDTNEKNTKKVISSLAYLWHEGSIISAVQTFESDLAQL